MLKRSEHCSNCRCWVQHELEDKHLDDPEALGDCCRFPPTVVDNSPEHLLHSTAGWSWPVTFASSWCAEWQRIEQSH